MSQPRMSYQDKVKRHLALYRKMGWSVIPVRRSDKKALVPWKEYQAQRPEKAQVEEWRKRFPDCNWAIITGQVSNLIVLDCDSTEAFESAEGLGLPPTPMVQTGRGRHCYFQFHPGIPTKQGVFLHIDLSSEGHYVVAPPSIHQNGTPYKWISSSYKDELSVLPVWVCAGLKTRNVNLNFNVPVSELYSPVTEGCRNEVLARLAGVWVKLGPSHAVNIARMWNAAWSHPPLPDQEVIQTVQSIMRAEDRKKAEREEGRSIIWPQKCQWVEQ
jgi:hypothetical protein